MSARKCRKLANDTLFVSHPSWRKYSSLLGNTLADSTLFNKHDTTKTRKDKNDGVTRMLSSDLGCGSRQLVAVARVVCSSLEQQDESCTVREQSTTNHRNLWIMIARNLKGLVATIESCVEPVQMLEIGWKRVRRKKIRSIPQPEPFQVDQM